MGEGGGGGGGGTMLLSPCGRVQQQYVVGGGVGAGDAGAERGSCFIWRGGGGGGVAGPLDVDGGGVVGLGGVGALASGVAARAGVFSSSKLLCKLE